MAAKKPAFPARSDSPLPWAITSYLKGLAIVAVIANHYAIFYFQAGYSYANSLMTLFFLLGGAGVYLSLEKDAPPVAGESGAGRVSPGFSRVFFKFVYRRASRIFPLYWLAYAIILAELLYLGQLDSFSLADFSTALAGVPTHPRGLFWFVTAILQCYLAAPLFYLMIRRYGAVSSLGIALVMTAVLLVVSPFLSDYLAGTTLLSMLTYKNLLLGNVLLYFLGMLIPSLLAQYRASLASNALWVAAAVAFILLIYATDIPGRLFTGSEIFLAPLLFLAAFIICLSLLAARPYLPLARPLGFAGDHSYPLYLLHQPLFILLATVGLIRENSYASIGLTLVVMPVFVACCFMLQRSSGLLSERLGRSIFAAGRSAS